jgi:hypothetical protein
MAKRQTHRLEIHGKYDYPIEQIERRSLPELEIKIDYLGKTEDNLNVWEGHTSLVGAGQKLATEELPAHLRKLVDKDDWMEITHRDKRSGNKEAMDWGDQTVAEFLMSGLFSMATLIGPDGKKYEYLPDLRVVAARVFS